MARKVALRMGKIMLRRKEVTSLVLRTVAPSKRATATTLPPQERKR